MKYKFAFDLDGTITKRELLPLIAKELGISRKMAVLTKKTMDGEIPFDHSFTKRVDMLKKIPISRVQSIIESVEISGPIVRFLQENKDRCFIITGNLDVWIEKLVKKIGVRCFCSEALYENDKLHGIKKILRKKDALREIGNPVVAIGEGHNDVEMLLDAHISIGYGGVHHPAPTVLEVASHVIYNDVHLCRFLKLLL